MREISKKKLKEKCKNCLKKFYYISQKGFCMKCLAERMDLARLQIKQKQGPVYEKWKLGMKRYLEELE